MSDLESFHAPYSYQRRALMARTRIRAGDADIVSEAKNRFERCEKWEADARENALEDARFANGDSVNMWQWSQIVRNARGNRPMLTMNKARQHILQIVNDARQHKAQVKITPTGGRASYEAAQVFAGIIRRIEYQSKAVDAYSTAIYHQVETGIGYVRVVTDFADDDSFDQEIFIRRIADPRTVYLDPDAKEYDKADMKFAFVFNDHERDSWEAKHGKDLNAGPVALDNTDGWNDKDHVREAEYWRRNEHNDTLHLLTDGSTVRESDLEDGELEQLKPHIVKSRDVGQPEVEWFRIAGDRIVERKVWLGKYIPIVPFIGEEVVIENRMDRKGHTRALIDAQRMYNYWSSAAVEQVALQNKSPYVATAQSIEGRERDWENANLENKSVLIYNGIDETGQKVERPERAQPPQMAQAYLEGMNIARQDMMMVSGQYEAEMGQPGNERSGVAIQQRQRQGDNATYHYIDNQSKGIRQVGRICLDLIPKVYDTARVMKIMAEDGSDSDIHLVPNAPVAHQQIASTQQGPMPVTPQQADAINSDPNQPDVKTIFNPNVGRYDVMADVGPSYGTQRQEAANAFSQIMQQNPAAFQLVGDFWAANSDFPGADELAERLKKGLPPQYADGPSAQVQQLQQQAQQMAQQAHQLLGQADSEIAALKQQLAALQLQAKDKAVENTTRDYDAETKRLQTVAQADPAAAQVIIRSMLSQLLGMPALPIMHEHIAADTQHAQSLMPPDPEADGGDGAAAPAPAMPPPNPAAPAPAMQ
jgi:hypothetical protein